MNEEEQRANKELIVTTLRNFSIEIESIRATIGPTITLYEIVPKAGTKISKIRSLESDIMLSLKATGIRIIAPIPGKGTVGIEVRVNHIHKGHFVTGLAQQLTDKTSAYVAAAVHYCFHFYTSRLANCLQNSLISSSVFIPLVASGLLSAITAQPEANSIISISVQPL